jgi:4-amino-4-deoxy-L-arabinose transferase-like glycosyltransferase
MGFQKIIKENKWIIVILLIALLVRVLFIFVMPVKFWDETVYANLGRDLSHNFFNYSFSHGWSDFIPSHGELFYAWPNAGFRAPLLPYLISFFYLFGIGFFLDFLIPIIGVLSVFLIYILGKKLFNENVALLSAAFLAFIPLHVFYSGRLLTEILATFFILLTFLSFWKGYEEGQVKYKILFGLALAISILARYTSLWIIPVFLFYFLMRDKSLKFLKDKYLWYSISVFFLALLPWFIYGFLTYENIFGAFIHGFKASTYWRGAISWTFYLSNWLSMFSILGIIFIASLFYIFYKKEYIKKQIYLPLLWFFLFLIFAIYMPYKEDRFLIPLIPPMMILCAYFFDRWKIKFKRVIYALVFITLLFSLVLNFYITATVYYNTNTACFEKIGAELNKLPGDFLIISENPSLFRYVSGHENAYYPDTLNEETSREIVNSAGKPVYFVFTKFNSGFETEKWQNLKKIMEKDYSLVYECSDDKEVNWIYSIH